MGKICFLMRSAFLGMQNKKFFNSLVILSVTICFLFPIFTISNMNYVVKTYGQPGYKDVEHTAVVDYTMNVLEEDRMEETIFQWNDKIKKVGFFVYQENFIEYQEESFVGGIAGFNPEFFQVSDTNIVDGRFPTQEEMESGAPVCLVVSSNKHGYRIGETIHVKGLELEIIGIFRDLRLYAGVIVPYRTIYPMLENNILQHKAYILTDGKPKIAKIGKAARETVEKIQYIDTAEGSEKPMMERFHELLMKKIKLSVIILIFTFISLTLIIAGKIMNDAYILGVKTAIGATRLQLLFDLFFQNLILMQLGVGIACLIYQGLFMFNNSDLFGLFDWTVIGIAEILCLVMTILITVIAVIPILTKPVIELFHSGQN